MRRRPGARADALVRRRPRKACCRPRAPRGCLATSPTGASRGSAGRRATHVTHVERVYLRVLPSPPPCSSHRRPSRCCRRGARAPRMLGAPLLLHIVMGSPLASALPFSPAGAIPLVERVGSMCGGRRVLEKEAALWKDDEEGMAGSGKSETSS
ncbi:hypothetical protein GQ55_7G277600 [Panicum hallii var. hallii]|uniref:Uncharacterized protein n=1 Tax=Panicum hallii var. hallii TaxID=1504633 RepID=A0A2T7CZR3_9POAL|nr:hypothetical protein GQ55_7G277600 [Panicum hallii var. hallii]